MAKRRAMYNDLWKREELIFLTECPLCRSVPDTSFVAWRRDRLPLKLCSRCGVLFVDPRPSDDALTRCYEQRYFTSSKDWSPIGPNKDYLRSIATMDQILGYNEIVSNLDLCDKAVLEIGCASGALLHSLQQHMPTRLVGIDIAEAPVKFGRECYGIDLRCTPLEDANFDKEEFDVILMLDVIEHVADVARFFAETAKYLRRGGCMFVRTPNADSITVAGRRWTYLYEGLEHVVYLSPKTLAMLARNNGMTCSKIWTDGCPAIVPYKRIFESALRLRRAASEPVKALLNYCSRRYFAWTETEGLGLNFFAIVRNQPH
jgi:2-polyprenyl-3-methyl-5-hydroxy-6-metoxy-1,4-benzoquinol methylase